MDPPTPVPEFKKPAFIGKLNKSKRPNPAVEIVNKVLNSKCDDKDEHKSTGHSLPPTVSTSNEPSDGIACAAPIALIPYKEPKWSDKPKQEDGEFTLEVLKSGVILGTLHLNSQAFWIFGRLEGSHILMAHPTISRYHAVLQYRPIDDDKPKGWYIFDLNSTHGTFVNKNRIPAKTYFRVKTGYMVKFGASKRNYILQGTDQDIDEGSEKTITQVIQEREQKIKAAIERQKQLEIERELAEKKREEQGISWGMSEDADEETDLAENPYASTNNEDLFLDDPKKTLRGFFEREGIELEYNVEEKGPGHFLCKVELPIDDPLGRPIVAECALKGKKKEVVVQCALEACRILDRAGVLRQASHEPRKRKQDSSNSDDDDDFLDRTGDVEKKRLRKAQQSQQHVSTHAELLEQEKVLLTEIADIEKKLNMSRNNAENNSNADGEDALDQFMSGLAEERLDKITIRKYKVKIQELKMEHAKLQRLIKIAQPNTLPELIKPDENDLEKPTVKKNKLMPLFGKRNVKKIQISQIDGVKNIDKEKEERTKNENGSDEEKLIKHEDNATQKIIGPTVPAHLRNQESLPVLSMDIKEENKTMETNIDLGVQETSDDSIAISEDINKKKTKSRKQRVRDRTKDDRNLKESETNIEQLGEKYNTWVPPQGQSGDGKTTLNEKFGY